MLLLAVTLEADRLPSCLSRSRWSQHNKITDHVKFFALDTANYVLWCPNIRLTELSSVARSTQARR